MFGSSKKVLVVDDERDLADAVGAVLKSWGKISIKKAFSVQEAIEVMNQESVDLVITDVNMHLVSGYQLIEYIYENRPGVPVILMSGKVNIYDDNECSKEVFDSIFAFFEKPFDFKELKTTVERALASGVNKAS